MISAAIAAAERVAVLKSYLDRIDLGLELAIGKAGFPVIAGCTLVQQKALRVMLFLDALERPSRIEVRDPDDESCKIIQSRIPRDADKEAASAGMQRMGIALAEAVAGRAYRVEGEVDLTVERKLEMLLAIGTPDRAAVGPATVLQPRLLEGG